MSKQKRVCLIGAGPSGMSVLHHYNKMKEQGKDVPEIVCYDKQPDWGGHWLYSWASGTGQYGELVHSSMYKGLWSNSPKERVEYSDYTYMDHFKKPMPSFLPREVIFDYLKGRWSQNDLRQWIHFQHAVRHVTYNDDTDDFAVVVKNLPEDKDLPAEKFDYVIVASGHFSVPNMPYFHGIEKFPGRIIHAHDFKNASQFKHHRVLVVGSSLSAEDIAIQTFKFGAKKIIISHRTRPFGYNWPPEVEERPLVTKIEGSTVHFKDGTSADVDSIILCTGYLHHFPYMEERLRLKSENVMYPPGLYKGVLWCHHGNNKLMYIGMQKMTITIYDVQAQWTMDYITGEIKLPDKKSMEDDITKWIQRSKSIEELDCEVEYVVDLIKTVNYDYDIDTQYASDLFRERMKCAFKNPLTFRDHCFVSKYSKVKSTIHHTPFMEVFDDSMEAFLDRKK